MARSILGWGSRHPLPAPAPEPDPGLEKPVIEVLAYPLVVGKPENPIDYAKFRIHQIISHVETHQPHPSHRFYAEARNEMYGLIHLLRLNGSITHEEEQRYLSYTVGSGN